jgi:hypothetical protein
MTRYLQFFAAALFLATSIGFTSCGADEVESEEEIIPEDQQISTETEIKLDLAIGDIPSPTKLTAEIPKAGASYDKSLMNPNSKASSYSSNYQKGINLGIYLADLSYAAVFNQSQDAGSYIATCKSMADGLGISQAFDDQLLKKFESNMTNPDSLVSVIDQAYANADKFLRSNDRVQTASLVLAGGWIEGLYVTTKIVGDSEITDENQKLFQSIGEQKFSLKNLINLVSIYKDNPDHAKLLEQLEVLKGVYDNIAKPSKINAAQVAAIRDKIVPLRDEIAG